MSGAVPKLRFPEFAGDWTETRLGTLTVKVGSGVTPTGGASSYERDGIPLIRSQNVRDNELNLADVAFISESTHMSMSGSRVMPNDVLLNITGASIGRSCIIPPHLGEANVNQHVCIIRTNSTLDPSLLQQFLSGPLGQKEIVKSQGGSGREGLNFENIRSFRVTIPSLPEQQKIASFLGAVDGKISGLRRKEAALVRFKAGLMQKLFSQKLRFTRDDGSAFPEWDLVPFEEAFVRVKRKNVAGVQNVLTISAQHGLVSQTDFFSKSVAATDLSNYYHLMRGDFAYNKSYSNGYPMGAIKRLKMYDEGVVSALYICFAARVEASAPFFEQYFDSGLMNAEIGLIAQEGARNHGLLNVSVVDFFEQITVPLPHPDEQRKIADALSAMDSKITTVRSQISKMETFKKGLLQQMFV